MLYRRWQKNAHRFINQLVNRLARRNYYTARAHFHHKLASADRRYEHPPLLIYQMGKVGSRTVFESLRKVVTDCRIYHLHILSEERIHEFEEWRKQFFPLMMKDLQYVWRCQYVSKRLKRRLGGKKWKIITLIRDPIARNLSDFFHNIEMEPAGSDGKWMIRGKRAAQVSEVYDFEITIYNNNLEELSEVFLKAYPHDAPSEWFDHQFVNVLGIDIYRGSFPTSKGYQIYEDRAADVLLLRLEDLNDCAAEAFREFLGIHNLILVNANIGSQKYYAAIYQAFKDSIIFPEAYLDRMYTSKYAQHFYSADEIERFRAKWSRKSALERNRL